MRRLKKSTLCHLISYTYKLKKLSLSFLILPMSWIKLSLPVLTWIKLSSFLYICPIFRRFWRRILFILRPSKWPSTTQNILEFPIRCISWSYLICQLNIFILSNLANFSKSFYFRSHQIYLSKSFSVLCLIGFLPFLQTSYFTLQYLRMSHLTIKSYVILHKDKMRWKVFF